MNKIIIAPSILTASFGNLEKIIKELEESGCDYLHLDIMDGVFVPQITFGAKIVADIKKISKVPLDAHLMIVNPENHIDDFAKAGVNMISVHFENNIHLHKLIMQIKSHNIKAGVVLNPHTRVENIEPIIDYIDNILIMSVNPGFGGQKFIESSIEKIKKAKKLIGNRDIILSVDGGINLNTCDKVIEAGANFLVSGSAIIDSEDKKAIINRLKGNKEKYYMELIDLVKNAKESTYKLQSLNTEIKNYALSEIAKNIEKRKNEIFEANNKDLENAKELLNNKKISLSMFNRLKLDDNKMIDIISGIKDVIKLEEPINKILTETELDDNLILKKVSCPIGLIAVIFEARPDVISQISSLCIKSSNAVILKGGSEGENTNKIIFEIINQVLSDIKEFPKNSVNLVFSREDIKNILSMDKYIDLIIPRGSNDLVQYIKANTNIPVLGHADGICHLYIDESANIENALKICLDSKAQYPSACNSVETILINKNIANEFLKKLYSLFKENEIKINGDEEVKKILSDIGIVKDWHKEYGDKEVSLKIVDNVEEA